MNNGNTGTARTVTVKAKWKPRFWVAGQTEADGRPTNRFTHHNVEIDGVTATVSTEGTQIWQSGAVNREVSLDAMITAARAAHTHDATRLYTLRLEPRAGELSNAPASPAMGTTATPSSTKLFDALYRPLEITFTFSAEFKIENPSAVHNAPHRGPHGMAVVHERRVGNSDEQTLDIDWKPDWLRRSKFGNQAMTRPLSRSRGGTATSVLVLHRTGLMGSAINEFTHPKLAAGAVKKGIHYIVDIDGHVLKMCHEDHAVNHTGFAGWRGATPLGNHSVGIEHINRGNDAFPQDQIDASLNLVEQILTARSIDRWDVTGHADIKTTSLTVPMTLHPSSRVACPGQHFPWDQFEDQNLALRARASAAVNQPYGYFTDPGQGPLRQGDRDNVRRYGGRTLSATEIPSNDIITEIHRDLNRIGWSPRITNPPGIFDDRMETMVRRFQARFRISPINGRVDETTAIRIRQVIAEMDHLGAP